MKKYCSCGKLLGDYYSKQCVTCYRATLKGLGNTHYIDGRSSISHQCIDCNKSISYQNKTRRCQKCSSRYLGLKHTGKNNNFWRGGLERFKCQDCHKQLSYGSSRCPSCSKKISATLKWQDSHYRVQQIHKILSGATRFPNKLELRFGQILSQLFQDRFQYCGNGSRIIAGYSPDFVDLSHKLVIELYGDFWHRYTQERDSQRLQKIEQSGYRVLVVWEHEVVELTNLIKKLENWVNENG